MLGALSWPILMGDADEMPQCIPAKPVIPASLGPVDGEKRALCESRFPTSTNREGLGKGSILTRLVSIAAIKAVMDMWVCISGRNRKSRLQKFGELRPRCPRSGNQHAEG